MVISFFSRDQRLCVGFYQHLLTKDIPMLEPMNLSIFTKHDLDFFIYLLSSVIWEDPITLSPSVMRLYHLLLRSQTLVLPFSNNFSPRIALCWTHRPCYFPRAWFKLLIYLWSSLVWEDPFDCLQHLAWQYVGPWWIFNLLLSYCWDIIAMDAQDAA